MPEIWTEHEGSETYAADSLESEGFIHCSFLGQLSGVIERYYAGVELIVILELDPRKILSEVRLEKSTNDEQFPHIYGPINLDAVVSVSLKKIEGIAIDSSGQVH